jgi:hypothetical protein
LTCSVCVGDWQLSLLRAGEEEEGKEGSGEEGSERWAEPDLDFSTQNTHVFPFPCFRLSRCAHSLCLFICVRRAGTGHLRDALRSFLFLCSPCFDPFVLPLRRRGGYGLAGDEVEHLSSTAEGDRESCRCVRVAVTKGAFAGERKEKRRKWCEQVDGEDGGHRE